MMVLVQLLVHRYLGYSSEISNSFMPWFVPEADKVSAQAEELLIIRGQSIVHQGKGSELACVMVR